MDRKHYGHQTPNYMANARFLMLAVDKNNIELEFNF